MKKTWKRWLGTVAAALVTSTALAQSPNEAGVVTMRGQSPTYSEEGSVRMGRASASATGTGIRQSQFTVDPGDVFEDALGGNAGGYYAENGGVGFAAAHTLNEIQWRVGNQSMEAQGYDGGYSNINAFIPLSSGDSQSLIFLNPRVNMSGSGNGGINVGLGYRFFDPVDDRVYGVSGWYDYDAGHRAAYSQMGVSLESLGRYFSARFNANMPLEDFNTFSTTNAFGTPFFQGNNVAYRFNFLRETSYQDYKVEVASPVPLLGRFGAEWAIGGYGLVANTSSAKSSMGISGRFELQVSEDFWINTVVSNDKIFGTNTSINLEVTIPNGRQTRWLRPNRGHERMLASVKRPYRVSTATNTVTETQFFLDPKDGTPIRVAHIDPTAVNGAAAGSVSNPFGSIQDYMNLTTAQRSPFDIIYVGRNAVDGSDVDLNTTIEVLNCQRLLGTGTLADGSVHRYQTLDRGDGFTEYDLPGFANGISQSSGANPFLSNSGRLASPVVRLNGNYTEVTGFTIDASGTADGIASMNAALVPRTVDSFVITNNRIQDASTAINIRSNTTSAPLGPSTLPESRTGGFIDNIGIVANNTIDGTAGIAPLVGVDNGINITQVAGTGANALNLSIRNNTLTSVGTDLDADGVLDVGTAITVTANAGTEILADGSDGSPFTGILDNTITNSASGVLMTALAGSHVQLDVLRNSVTGSTNATSSGMTYNATGGEIDFDVFGNNTVTGGAGLGVVLNSTLGGDINFEDPIPVDPILHPIADSVFINNTISNNALTGLTIAATGAGSTINIDDMTTNTISANGGDGINARALAGAVVTVGPMTGNTISNNVGDGIDGSVNGVGSVLDLRIGDADVLLGLNTITGNTGNGINLTSTNGGSLNAPIIRNTITGNTLDGIHYTLTNTTQNSIDIEDNTVRGNQGDGIDIVADTTAINNILLDRNAVEGNTGGDGVRFQMTDSSVTNLTVQNSLFNFNRDNGINFELDNTPIQNLSILNNVGQLQGFDLGVTFTVNGETHPRIINGVPVNASIPLGTWSINNNSTPGIDITSVAFNLLPPFVFDTIPFGGAGSFPFSFTPFNNSDVNTGLQQVNGTAVPPYPAPLVADGSTALNLDFNNFNTGETFRWDIDVDPADNGATTGNLLVGSTVAVTFSNGITLPVGALALVPGDADAARFVGALDASSITGISNNGLDGIRLNATNGSNIGNLLIDNNQIESNDGRGINATLINSTIATAGSGVVSNNRINNNALEGVRFDASQNSTLDLLIGGVDPALNGNTISGNGDANVSVDLSGISTGNVVVQNNTITNAVNGPSVDFAGDGVVFRTTDTTRLHNAQVIGNTITGNAGDGLRLLANAMSQVHATGDPTSAGLLVTGNTISANLDDGIQIQREGDAIIRSIIGTTGGVGVDPLLGNTITGNTAHGINILTGGGSTPAGVSTDVTIGQNTISGNGTTTVGNGVNIVTNDDSQTRVDLISNVIQGLGTQDNGVSVTTNNASIFGVFGGANSQFDGNIISGHTADGIVLTTNNISQLGVDITGNTQQSVISGNEANGVSVVDQSTGAVMVVNIGNPASSGAGPGADALPDAPDVVIAQNGNDAIRVAQIGGGSIDLNVNNTHASGRRVTGGVSRHGLSYNSDGQLTGGTANLTVDNSTFVDFGGDGINIDYNHLFFDPGANILNVNVTDSIIGQTQFSTNVGDGVDIVVRDNGARFNFANNTIQNNGADGFRMVTLAEDMSTARIDVFPDRDGNADGTNETTDPDNPFLPGNLWADPIFVDFTTNLSLTNNLIRFNGQDGVDLAIGAGTRLGTLGNRAIVRGNTMTGNAVNGFLTRTITNEAIAPPTDSVNRGENTVDTVRLDPMAFLFLAFGDNVQPNITTQLNPTVTGGVIVAADAIKASPNRDIITRFDVNTNDLNDTINAGLPVLTLGAFTTGWSTFTITNNVLGQGFIAPINTGNVNNVP